VFAGGRSNKLAVEAAIITVLTEAQHHKRPLKWNKSTDTPYGTGPRRHRKWLVPAHELEVPADRDWGAPEGFLEGGERIVSYFGSGWQPRAGVVGETERPRVLQSSNLQYEVPKSEVSTEDRTTRTPFLILTPSRLGLLTRTVLANTIQPIVPWKDHGHKIRISR
jgi:hypothetical protein